MRASDPSERNYAIFCEVQFDGASLRSTAEKYGISPTRVQQIVDQVEHWYKATTPAWVAQCEPQQQPVVACRVLQDRLHRLYGHSMDAWRASQAEVSVRRERADARDSGSVTTTRSFGQVRYLAQAARLAAMEVTAAQRLATITAKQAPAAATKEAAPPTRGCARLAEEEPVVAEEEPEISPVEMDVCDLDFQSVLTMPAPESPAPNPVRSHLARRLARHEKRKAARERKRARQWA